MKARAPGERGLLAAACLATTLVPFSSTMLAVALPDLQADFDLSVAAAVWMISAYLVVTAATQLVAGNLGDLLGRRPLAIGGVFGFGIASALAAAAPQYSVAIAARCLQAVCGAFALVNVAALVRTVLPAMRLGRAFGLLGTSATLSAAAGPPVGGIAVEWAGWRGPFLVVLPMVVLALYAVVRWLPADVPAPAGSRRRFDPLGAALLLATLVTGAVLVNQIADGVGVLVIGPLAAVTVVCVVGFVVVERAHPAPVLDLSVLRVRAVASAGATIAASNLAMYVVLLAVPLVLTGGSSRAGLVLTPMLLTAAVFSPIGGRAADRFGRRYPAVVGNVVLAAAFLALVPVDVNQRPGLLALLLAVAGAGLGVAFSAIQTAGAEALPVAQAGVAAGLFSTSRYLGSILGVSLLALLVSDRSGHAVFAVAAAAAVCSAAGALAMPADRHAFTVARAPRTVSR